MFSAAKVIQSDQLKAVFLPEYGMVGVSLQFSGVEILRKIEDLESAARRGSSVGIPILYPWANRLSQFEFDVAGKRTLLDRSSPLLHLDQNGLPNHGVPWSNLEWQVQHIQPDQMIAGLNWNTPDLLQIFPFEHTVEMNVAVESNALKIITQVTAGDSKVPISFGFHPYVGIPNLNRSLWRLKLPRMKKLVLDDRQIPTGDTKEFAGFDAELGTSEFDDGFELIDLQSKFSIEGNGWKISTQLQSGYAHAQVFAPRDKDFIALEPMTSPANALVSGRNLRILEPGETFSASFAIVIESNC
jgi:aldose 1-epimerase